MSPAPKPTVPPEVMKLFDQFASQIEEYGSIERPADEPSFGMANLLETYDAGAAVKLLMNGAPSYYGHKEATFFAFCGWAVAPFDPDVRFDLIGIAIKQLVAEAEDKAARLDIDSNTAADMIARYYFAGSQFIFNIYTAFQGAGGFLAFGSGALLEDETYTRKKDYMTIVKLMACCHYVSAKRVNSKRDPSVNFAMRFLEKNSDDSLKSSTATYAMWGQVKENIAFIYAASSIKVSPSKTLLDVVLSGDLKFSRDHRFFRTWMRRTRFVCDSVLRLMSDELQSSNSKFLGGLEAESFVFDLTADEVKLINSNL
jgi:hypothetical protein